MLEMNHFKTKRGLHDKRQFKFIFREHSLYMNIIINRHYVKMSLTNSVLEAQVRDFLKHRHPHLSITHVVELQNYLQFILVDEGDFEGLSEFCDEFGRRFNGSVELKRDSTKSFQLELLVPVAREKKSSKCFDGLPWLVMLGMTLGSSLYAISVIYSGSVPPN